MKKQCLLLITRWPVNVSKALEYYANYNPYNHTPHKKYWDTYSEYVYATHSDIALVYSLSRWKKYFTSKLLRHNLRQDVKDIRITNTENRAFLKIAHPNQRYLFSQHNHNSAINDEGNCFDTILEFIDKDCIIL